MFDLTVFRPYIQNRPTKVHAYTWACLIPVFTVLIALPLSDLMGIGQIMMLFVLAVFLAALWLGTGPALLVTILSTALCDIFFIPPYGSAFAALVAHTLMLSVMILMALLTGMMTATILEKNQELHVSAGQTQSLYRMARELAGAVSMEEVNEIASRYPSSAPAESLLSIAHERVQYAEMAQAGQIQIESERLRNSILSSLSHDLRTPLTALVGLTDTLTRQSNNLSSSQSETVVALHEQSVRLAGMVSKLLDLARLSSGSVVLRKEWQPIQEVVSTALNLLASALQQHRVVIEIPDDFPLLEFDAVLIERVLGNLLDNAAKYTPTDSAVTIRATQDKAAGYAIIQVCDSGEGFHWNRDQVAHTQEFSGLGLMICEAITKAHGGVLTVEHSPLQTGVCVQFTLPLGTPPSMEEELEEEV